MNQAIRSPEIRLIDEQGQQLGVMPTRSALELARERDLDLVEVAPNATPPVCRLLDYDKFRYLQTKKERESKKGHKLVLLRQVRFRVGIGSHDKEAKVRQIRKLLGEGAKVKISVFFRGREITHPELGATLLRGIAEELKDEARLEQTPTMEGRALAIVMIPSPQKATKVTNPEKELTGAQVEDS
ncbi:MAG: translation initiation factor IF-3 [Chloroflexi bacterium]|nr:translation initiation factor IF-3 [Chloroflexota bacterium]